MSLSHDLINIEGKWNIGQAFHHFSSGPSLVRRPVGLERAIHISGRHIPRSKTSYLIFRPISPVVSMVRNGGLDVTVQ